jgi:signal transduction histidine kinase
MTTHPVNPASPVTNWLARPSGMGRVVAAIVSMALLGLIGWIDYLADYRVLFTVVYVLPIAYAAVKVSRGYAVVLAVLSIILWTGGDILGAAPSPGVLIRIWNDVIIFSLFIIVIYLLNALDRTFSGLEAAVRDRTAELREEMEERRRLEHETLDLSERERQAFGHELHDVVCQELASIAVAGHMLAKKLQDRGAAEAGQAREIAALVDRALMKARSVARGFFTDGFNVLGLAEALRENARNVEDRTGVTCEVAWQENIVILNEDVVMHFFRIAQEGIQNAVRHADASRIRVALSQAGETVRLTIDDDGKGPGVLNGSARGLGLRIMKYRASLIGGELKIDRSPLGGFQVLCVIPIEMISRTTAMPVERR